MTKPKRPLAAAERGRAAHFRGKRFEDEVAVLYRLLGFETILDTQISGMQIDLQIKKREGGLTTQAIVECKNTRVTAKERDQLLAQQNLLQKKLPKHRWIAVSAEGFAADTRAALEETGPVLIPLREVRKDVALDSIVVRHFRDRGLPGVSFPRFEHLVQQGKIVLFFDAFDEMADRVRWDVTQANFQELRRAAVAAGKVVLTCRTHYFKDRTEQVKLMGGGQRSTAPHLRRPPGLGEERRL